jgi:hypothetical protein
MVVRLSALCTGCPLLPGRFLVLISIRGFVNPRAIVLLEGLGQFKNPMISSGIEATTAVYFAMEPSTVREHVCTV